MSIDVFREQILTFSQAARRLPKLREGKKIHPSTIYRWMLAGKRSRDGSIIRLEAVKIGGTNCTSMEALQRFFDRLSGDLEVVSPPTITQRRRLHEIEEVERQLKELGL